MKSMLKTGFVGALSAVVLVGAGVSVANAEAGAASPAAPAAAPHTANQAANQPANGAAKAAGNNANAMSERMKAARTPGYGTRSGSRPDYRYGARPAPRYPAPRQGYQGYRAPRQGYRAPQYRAPSAGNQGYRGQPRSYYNYRRPTQGYRSYRPGYGAPAPRYNARNGNSYRPRPRNYKPRDKGNVNFGSRPSRPRYRSRPRYDDDDSGLNFNMVDMIPLDDKTRLPWEGKHWKGVIPEKFTDKFGKKWDKMVNEPSKHKMPGGWYAPSIDAPNPAEVANEFDNAARDFKKNNK